MVKYGSASNSTFKPGLNTKRMLIKTPSKESTSRTKQNLVQKMIKVQVHDGEAKRAKELQDAKDLEKHR